MSEFSALVAFGEGARDVSDTAFGAFAIHSLPALKAEFGRDSEEYKTAVLALKAVLTTVSFLSMGMPILSLLCYEPAVRSSNLALIFLNSKESSHPRSETANPAAAQSSQAPFPAFPPGNAPIYSHSVCHLTAESCVNGTSECSGRGQCVSVRKGPKTCFVCQCTVTKDSKNRTEHWSGSACQTQDFSVYVFSFLQSCWSSPNPPQWLHPVSRHRHHCNLAHWPDYFFTHGDRCGRAAQRPGRGSRPETRLNSDVGAVQIFDTTIIYRGFEKTK